MGIRAGNQTMYFEFAIWALSRGRVPTAREVEGYFDVSRESAWRIHRNWLTALQHHRETNQRPAATGTTATRNT